MVNTSLEKNHVITARVYFEDTDAGGIVYHANYLKYMERGRTEWLRAIGFEQDVLLEQNLAFVVKRMNVEYRAAGRFNDLLSIHTQIVELKGASLLFSQIIKNEQNTVITESDVVVACIKLSAMRPCRIPAQILGEISRVI